MVSPDAFLRVDRELAAQLRFALASPLWKFLPYGVEPNPRHWHCELLALSPGRRLSLKVTAPWRDEGHSKAPLAFVLDVRHAQCGDRVHARLRRLNDLLRAAERDGRSSISNPFFYDELARALVYPAYAVDGDGHHLGWMGCLHRSGMTWLLENLKNIRLTPSLPEKRLAYKAQPAFQALGAAVL